MPHELNIGNRPGLHPGRHWRKNLEEVGDKMLDAIDLAADQGQKTWLLSAEGERIAAIVPVDVAEEDDRRTAGVLQTPVRQHDLEVAARAGLLSRKRVQ